MTLRLAVSAPPEYAELLWKVTLAGPYLAASLKGIDIINCPSDACSQRGGGFCQSDAYSTCYKQQQGRAAVLSGIFERNLRHQLPV